MTTVVASGLDCRHVGQTGDGNGDAAVHLRSISQLAVFVVSPALDRAPSNHGTGVTVSGRYCECAGEFGNYDPCRVHGTAVSQLPVTAVSPTNGASP
jgi:hypothetical protein